MKKVLFAVMAMMTIGFASCGNKTQASAEASDSAAVINVEDESAAMINALTEQLEAKDANKFQEALAAIQEKIKALIASNPEAAKNLVDQVQAFLKENAEKIKEFAGDNAAVTAAVASLTEAPAERRTPKLLLTRLWRIPKRLLRRRLPRASMMLLVKRRVL